MVTCLREPLRRRQGTPLAAFFNRPIHHCDFTFSEMVLNLMEAEIESMVDPNGV